jgi:hypothetical protein
MADSRADSIIREHEQMASDRGIWEAHWREVAERVLPRANWFNVTNKTEGEKKTEKVFDATSGIALERFAAAMESMLTPRTQRWHRLKTRQVEMMDDPEIQAYLDEVTNILFQVRYSPKANFASQVHETYMSLGAFGSGAIFIDDVPRLGIRYKSIHLSEIYFTENFAGVIDKVHRKFEMTARQAAQKWGYDNVPEKIRTALEKSPEKKFEFLHCVKPNEDIKPGMRNYRGMPFASYYIAIDSREMLSEGGYNSFPYAVSRYVTGPKEIYGRSPAMTVLPDIKMINEMSKTVIRAAHKIVDPPLLLQEDGVLQAFNMRPGALNYGGVDDQGRQTVQPLQTGARVDIGLDMMDQRRRVINDAFLITLFQILVEAPNMTATEAMLRAQEKGALLAPTMGRQQSEMLGPMIERELDILGRNRMLPPMPESLANLGGEVDIEYVSPLNRAQRAEEGVAILRTLEAVTPLAQIDPSVMMIFNPEAIARELSEINGVPAKILRTKEEVEAIKEEQAQAAQAAQLLEAAPVLSSSARNLAEAGAVAGNVPAPLPI